MKAKNLKKWIEGKLCLNVPGTVVYQAVGCCDVVLCIRYSASISSMLCLSSSGYYHFNCLLSPNTAKGIKKKVK